MSECVVRMEMPKRCFDCPMHDWIRSSVVCNAHHELKPIPNADEKPSWCPIVCQLPEGHGDLVEAKEITVNVTIKGKKCSADVYATTIVPAERSET